MKSNPIQNSTLESITGCILGTALGDAVGLKREGLSRDRAIWMHGEQPSPDLIFGRGYCSDDTEHTVMVGCAMLKSGGDVSVFQSNLAGYFRSWLLSCPAGIGLGTLRAIIKSFFVGANNSGVHTAGNGPAMRSGLIGLLAYNDKHLVNLVRASTRITHTDPKAEEGALVVARAARFAKLNPNSNPQEFVEQILPKLNGDEMIDHFRAIQNGLTERLSPREFAAERGWEKGPTGYINQSVPAAVYCWAHSPNDFREVITNAVLLGGDTDSVGAIAGSIAGAGCGSLELPQDWLDQLAEWPRDIQWMKNLAVQLDQQLTKRDATHDNEKHPIATPSPAPSMRWCRSFFRNLVFGVTVILLYFRRFIPIGHKKPNISPS